MSQSGIIPALAGNTPHALLTLSESGDHPRACGEHFQRFYLTNLPTGSSPRLRGTQAGRLLGVYHYGIIPALAGNTGAHAPDCDVCRDHPRACGEHPAESTIVNPLLGSSPRLRGTREADLLQCDSGWIIPALAGNTSPAPEWRSDHGDHPRACGEHGTMSIRAAARQGSSPRLRGTLQG